MITEERTRCWHCILRNPHEHGFKGDEKQIMKYIKNRWDNAEKGLSVAVTYYIYPDETSEYRIVLQSEKLMRISALKKKYPLLFDEVRAASRHTSYSFLENRFEKGYVKYVTKGWKQLSGTYYNNLSLGHYNYID